MFLVLKHNSLLTYTNFCIKRVFFLRKQKNMLTKNMYSFPCASNKNKNHNVLLSYCACFCGYEEMHFYVYFKAHKYLSFIFGIFRLNKSSWFDGHIHYSEFQNVKYKRFLLYKLFISQKKLLLYKIDITIM